MLEGTVAGIYCFRRLQIKCCGRPDRRTVLALDCCSDVQREVQRDVQFDFGEEERRGRGEEERRRGGGVYDRIYKKKETLLESLW